ncbi:uncharacterized protein BCR38DRAFT_487846 [Pseudomassariella vexata]|uniref:Azaphilone pigments biosynthesis cluster protein L N-terminal domain-containing protein n=1 Tax=Pseudomassariella vexata TaxID=1141098 RepID=A0A1Y2DNC1_9PEZI|nr:uncharacterized protein BCR38DRAFT_487846 [Pseudomassariella vexata]ORY60788.1 hypothetical protein BCR38DRAFT_487846 [Pseudomassariella vexata]
MDPFSVTASVIAIATLALQSAKAAYDLVDGLAEAPLAIARSKTSLMETQKILGALQQMLTTASEPAGVIEPVLRMIELAETLKSARHVCDQFSTAIVSFTSHSTDGRFSKRDRLTVNFHEPKIHKLNKELDDCQRTVSMVLDGIGRLGDCFRAQEQALANLDTYLHDRQTPSASEEDSVSNGGASLQLAATLQNGCQEARSTTRAKRTGQEFGDMSTDDQSRAMQGIVGEAHDGVEQSFGKMTTSKNSRAFQGQIDAAFFAAMFSN